MPFPTVDYRRYIKLGANIATALVIVLSFSSSTHTTIILLPKVLDLEPGEIFSLFSLLHLPDSDTTSTEHKF